MDVGRMHPLSRFAPSPSKGTPPVAWQSQFHGGPGIASRQFHVPLMASSN